MIQSSLELVTVIIVIPLAASFVFNKSIDAWTLAGVILPEPSTNSAILEPSGRFSIPHMVYQSEVSDASPLSLLTWTGPNVNPFAVSPGTFEVSLIAISTDPATIVPLVDPLLILTLNVSVLSVVKSSTSVFVNDPVSLLLITNDPDVVLSVKSAGATPNPSIV